MVVRGSCCCVCKLCGYARWQRAPGQLAALPLVCLPALGACLPACVALHAKCLLCTAADRPSPTLLYSDSLQFWDDMQWNTKDVAGLGVVAVYAPQGLTAAAWEKGLQQYAARRSRA